MESRSWRERVDVAVSLALLVGATACGGSQPGGGSGDDWKSPPACTPPEAPFAKITNPAFVPEFEHCTVTTDAQFNAPDWGGMVGGDIEGLVKWSAVVPGTSDVKTLYIPKARSDVLFRLKKGEAITIKGTPKANLVRQVMVYAAEVTPAAR